MALTQIQVIQSLGEAMTWLERELGWGVPATELRHLVGRIGELYAAVITNGQIAPEVNQPGYDVVSSDGKRVSVKTTAKQGHGPISFNPNTLDQVDRVMILRLDTEEMQIETLLDATIEDARGLMSGPSAQHKFWINVGTLLSRKPPRPVVAPVVVKRGRFAEYEVRELESGTIEVLREGTSVPVVKPVLREIAKSVGVATVNSNGNEFNTRQLGSLLLRQFDD